MGPLESILVGAALVLFLSVIVSKAAVWSGIPVLLIFLVMGMLAGSDGPGGIYFDNPPLAQAVGVVSLAFILFSGGLDTNWQDVRPVVGRGLLLATVGVCITALLVGIVASMLLGFTLTQGVLLGAIISSTDAAAVFSVLRAKNVSLKGQLKPLLEFESGSNDPMAVFLTVGLTQLLLDPSLPAVSLIPLFIRQMALGGALGYLIGRGMTWIVNHLRLEYEGLYPVFSVAVVLFAYGATASLGGNGFLAVYLAGLVMGNRTLIHKTSLRRFHDGLAWLMQIAMFLTLGLQVFPSRLGQIIPVGMAIAGFLILFARPVSVFAVLAFSRFTWREKGLVSWVGLRGAAPIILATFPQVAGLPGADTIFNLVFFIVLTSVLLQGPLIVSVAKWLGVRDDQPPRAISPLEHAITRGLAPNDLFELTVPHDSPIVGRQLLDVQLPENTLVVLIGREGNMIVPNGGTVVQAGDGLVILARQEAQATVRQIIEGSAH